MKSLHITLFPLMVLLIVVAATAEAQVNPNYWDRSGYLSITAGPATPGRELSSTADNGLLAENGLLADLDYNYMIGYGFGVGLNLGLDHFGLNEEAFTAITQPLHYSTSGGFSSIRVGLNFLMNVPLVILRDKFCFNLFGELNGGLRSFSIPEVNLTYSELFNKYTEVTYRSRDNTMGYAGYSTGLQFVFLNRFGVNISYSAIFNSQHRINYSVRASDAMGQLYEEENFLSAKLDRTGFQVGVLFLIGQP